MYHHTQHESIYYTGPDSRWENDQSIITAPCLALVGFCSHALDSLALWASRFAPSDLKPNLMMSLSSFYLELFPCTVSQASNCVGLRISSGYHLLLEKLVIGRKTMGII